MTSHETETTDQSAEHCQHCPQSQLGFAGWACACGWTMDRTEYILARRAEGWSYRRLGRVVGLSAERVRQITKRATGKD